MFAGRSTQNGPPPQPSAAGVDPRSSSSSTRSTMSRSMNHASRLVAFAAVFLAACQDGATPPTGPSIPATPQSARSPQAQARLEAIFQNTKTEVMGLPGTIFADNDEAAGKVVYGVENAGAEIAVRNQMARMGVADADFDVMITKPIVFAATLRDAVRPVVAGLQIHFSRYVCSIGFNADKGTEASFVTASHCTTTQGGTEGTNYYQPSSSTPNSLIATEVDDPQYVKGGAKCPKGKKCRWSDASRAKYADGVNQTRGMFAKTDGVNTNSLTIEGAFTVTSQDNTTTSFADTRTVLNKVGRTTGWTQGKVGRTCIDTGVSGSTVYLFCQTTVNAGVAGGDSGSGVFEILSGDNVKLVGILWGGASDNSYFVFSPLKQVQDELGALTATK
jgi:hypothetical protein